MRFFSLFEPTLNQDTGGNPLAANYAGDDSNGGRAHNPLTANYPKPDPQPIAEEVEPTPEPEPDESPSEVDVTGEDAYDPSQLSVGDPAAQQQVNPYSQEIIDEIRLTRQEAAEARRLAADAQKRLEEAAAASRPPETDPDLIGIQEDELDPAARAAINKIKRLEANHNKIASMIEAEQRQRAEQAAAWQEHQRVEKLREEYKVQKEKNSIFLNQYLDEMTKYAGKKVFADGANKSIKEVLHRDITSLWEAGTLKSHKDINEEVKARVDTYIKAGVIKLGSGKSGKQKVDDAVERARAVKTSMATPPGGVSPSRLPKTKELPLHGGGRFSGMIAEMKKKLTSAKSKG